MCVLFSSKIYKKHKLGLCLTLSSHTLILLMSWPLAFTLHVKNHLENQWGFGAIPTIHPTLTIMATMITIKDILFNRDLIPSWEGVIQHTLLWLWLLTLTIVNHPMKLWKQINIYHLFNNYVRHKYSRVDSLGTSHFHLITHIEIFFNIRNI
jgi:hypothetical protein